jgi:hypothetical protein
MNGMLHRGMERVTVRVVPRSRRASVDVADDGSLVVRVRAAPEHGKATEEAARMLASHYDVSPGRVRLVRGRRGRIKVFEVDRDRPAQP